MAEEKIERMRIRRRRYKQLLDYLKENIKYWNLKQEIRDRILWRTRFGRGYETFARQTAQ